MVDEGWTTVEKKGPRDMPPRRGEGAAASNGGRGGGGRGGMGGALALLENTNYDLRGRRPKHLGLFTPQNTHPAASFLRPNAPSMGGAAGYLITPRRCFFSRGYRGPRD